MNKTACARVTVFIGACLALILAIIAIAVPYWEYVQFDETASYYGLWRGCMADQQYDICHSLGMFYVLNIVLKPFINAAFCHMNMYGFDFYFLCE